MTMIHSKNESKKKGMKPRIHPLVSQQIFAIQLSLVLRFGKKREGPFEKERARWKKVEKRNEKPSFTQ
jgi:hypothetical protein